MAFTITAKLRCAFLVPMVCLILAAPGAAQTEVPSEDELAAELAVAKSLEHAISGSDRLGLLTKLVIKSRLDEVRAATMEFRDGKIPQYDLWVTFESAMAWLEGILGDTDRGLRSQLVEARPALWKIVVSSMPDKGSGGPAVIDETARQDRITR